MLRALVASLLPMPALAGAAEAPDGLKSALDGRVRGLSLASPSAVAWPIWPIDPLPPVFIWLSPLSVTATLEPATLCAGQVATLTVVVSNNGWWTGWDTVGTFDGTPIPVSITSSDPALPSLDIPFSPAPPDTLLPGQSFTTLALVTAPSSTPPDPWPWSLSVTVQAKHNFWCPSCRWFLPICLTCAYPVAAPAEAAPSALDPSLLVPWPPSRTLLTDISATAQSNTVLVKDCGPGPTPTPPPFPVELIREIGVYPNPFSERAHLAFRLSMDAQVRVAIYNVAGELISRLEKACHAGKDQVVWEGLNALGGRCASEVYLVRVSAKGVSGAEGDYWTKVVVAR